MISDEQIIMNSPHADVSEKLLQAVSEWLTQSAMNGAPLETLVAGVCERLNAAGVPLVRVHMSISMLHPLYDALGFTWLRGKGVKAETFTKPKDGQYSDRMLRSPYYHLVSLGLGHLRRRIGPDTADEFPIFEDLKELGATDYMAFLQSFGTEESRGMLGSWSTDNPGGFSEGMIAGLMQLQNSMAIAFKLAVLSQLAGNMLNTYLGQSAGERVLAGQVRRGDASVTRAIVVMADMRRSTMLAEKEGRQVYVETLNRFFDAVAAPFNRNGGEILSFIGDGFIAVYPCDRHHVASEEAAQAAMAAALAGVSNMREYNRERREKGKEPIAHGIGLHVGNVMFGNVGLKDRLTFSVFGRAVNEAQRLQSLTKKYERPIIASQEFADYCGGSWIDLGAQKLRGVSEALTVKSPAEIAEIPSLDFTTEAALETFSEAEELMRLYKNSKLGSSAIALQQAD